MGPVSIVLLGYRSVEWLDFAIEGIRGAANDTPYHLLVIGNDATSDVLSSGRLTYRFFNDNPKEHYLARVYRAWNFAIRVAPTRLVIPFNSDMYPAHGWLDSLVKAKRDSPKTIPSSLLIESGRIPSAFAEYVCDLGHSPSSFNRQHWQAISSVYRQTTAIHTGRLFMPCVFDQEDFNAAGGYPEGNVKGVAGDKILFDEFANRGFKHTTIMGSVVYHVQEGEMRC